MEATAEDKNQPLAPPSYEDSTRSPKAIADQLDAKEGRGPGYVPVPNPIGPQVVQPQVVQPQAVVTQIMISGPNHVALSDKPVVTRCFQCAQTVETATIKELKGEAYTLACILCFFTGILCVWIPFVMDSMYKTVHHCPVCQAQIGTYNP